MLDAPWLIARDSHGESVAAGFPLASLLDLLVRHHAGKTLVIRDLDERIVAVRHHDGTVSTSTPLEKTLEVPSC
jgi:hypothetical protein